MRNYGILAMLAASVLFASCKKEPVKMKEPQAPVIESASLKGLSGESAVEAGAAVKFTAAVSVEGSTLGTYSVKITKNGRTIGSDEGALEGTAAVIEKELSLSVIATEIEEDFMPEVTVKVTNNDGLYTEQTLSAGDNVTIKAPEVYEQLYLIASSGKTYTMKQTAEKGKYRTDSYEDFDGIGASFTIASALKDGKADGKVWENIPVPDSGEYGLVWIGYNILTGEVSKMVDHTEVFDYNTMADDAAQGYKVYWARTLVQDCKCEFLNYPAGLKLQADRFDDVDGTTARYTGPTNVTPYEVYHVADVNWLIIKYQWSAGDSMWITGENSSLPMVPYCEGPNINWFVNDPNGICATSTLSMMKTDADNWRGLAYLKGNFSFKLYSGWGWGFEVSPLKSATPGNLVISPLVDDSGNPVDGNYANPGADFTEGLYMVRYDSMRYEVSLEKYSDANLPVIK